VETHLTDDGFVASEADALEGRLDTLLVHFLLQVAQHVIQGGVHGSLRCRKAAISHPENYIILFVIVIEQLF
jgi:hypothetical protein